MYNISRFIFLTYICMIVTSSSYGKYVDCSRKKLVSNCDFAKMKCDDYHDNNNHVCKEAIWGGCTNSEDRCQENSNSSWPDDYVEPDTSTEELTDSAEALRAIEQIMDEIANLS